MKKPMIDFINRSVLSMLERVLRVTPSTKKEEVENIFKEVSSTMNATFSEDAFYMRDKFGKVSKFLTIKDLAAKINYTEKTIECYLSKGGGEATFKNILVSTIPLLETEISQVEESFWLRDLNGKVLKFATIEEVAKICNIKVKTLEVYLSVGKGQTVTKNGVISTSQLYELSPTDNFEQNYYLKHGYWPDPAEVPDIPKVNSSGRRL